MVRVKVIYKKQEMFYFGLPISFIVNTGWIRGDLNHTLWENSLELIGNTV